MNFKYISNFSENSLLNFNKLQIPGGFEIFLRNNSKLRIIDTNTIGIFNLTYIKLHKNFLKLFIEFPKKLYSSADEQKVEPNEN